MIDIDLIRQDPEGVQQAFDTRGFVGISVAKLVEIDRIRREAIQAAQQVQTERNTLSKQAGKAKREGDDAGFHHLMHRVGELRESGPMRERAADEADRLFRSALEGVPNIPSPNAPIGRDEQDNRWVRSWGDDRRLLTGLPHDELGPPLGMDGEAGAALSGSRFTVLRQPLAGLERALGQFMLDLHGREHGYEECAVPVVVNPSALYGTGQLPKFADDLYPVGGGQQYLIPTAEVSLTNLVADRIVPRETLPLRLTALTPCFRSEAGSAGRDTRGMMRQHQFNKVELVAITTPEQSEDEHRTMLEAACAVLRALELPYRVVDLCTGDMGFSAQRTFDIEVWLPGQNAYREISSVSICGDFQARRMNARTRDGEGKTVFVHTLNGSGVAVGRALVALMENHQQPDGSIRVPEVLRPYLGGCATIAPR